MKIFLDTSDVDVIKHYYQTGLIDGVTTNPTLMMQAERNPVDIISEISDYFPEDASVSAEVVADTAEEMISQAKQYYSISSNVTIKVPCTYEGLKACKKLSSNDIPVNVTLIFSLNQAILAAKSGARYVSPFVGRCEDNDIDGVGLISSIHNVLKMHNFNDRCSILSASIRSIDHVNKVFENGTDIATLPPSIFEEMYQHYLTNEGLLQFDKDWKKVTHQ